jgi:hypothetical protein
MLPYLWSESMEGIFVVDSEHATEEMVRKYLISIMELPIEYKTGFYIGEWATYIRNMTPGSSWQRLSRAFDLGK